MPEPSRYGIHIIASIVETRKTWAWAQFTSAGIGFMGHSYVRTTMIYTHVMEGNLKEISSPLDDLNAA